MQLANFLPVKDDLQQAGVGIVIIATSTPAHARKMISSLGFQLPGAMVFDPEKNTHQALELRCSISASLITPFMKHIPTFGPLAVLEALRVSLINIGPNGSHGTSWQQGGTFALRHTRDGKEISCEFEWREDYPGHWANPSVILDAMGIKSLAECDVKERLKFVIAQRQLEEKRGGRAGGIKTWLFFALLIGIFLSWLLFFR